MDSHLISDLALVRAAVDRLPGGQSQLARIMTNDGIPTSQPTISRWMDGIPIVRDRIARREWLLRFLGKRPNPKNGARNR